MRHTGVGSQHWESARQRAGQRAQRGGSRYDKSGGVPSRGQNRRFALTLAAALTCHLRKPSRCTAHSQRLRDCQPRPARPLPSRPPFRRDSVMDGKPPTTVSRVDVTKDAVAVSVDAELLSAAPESIAAAIKSSRCRGVLLPVSAERGTGCCRRPRDVAPPSAAADHTIRLVAPPPHWPAGWSSLGAPPAREPGLLALTSAQPASPPCSAHATCLPAPPPVVSVSRRRQPARPPGLLDSPPAASASRRAARWWSWPCRLSTIDWMRCPTGLRWVLAPRLGLPRRRRRALDTVRLETASVLDADQRGSVRRPARLLLRRRSLRRQHAAAQPRQAASAAAPAADRSPGCLSPTVAPPLLPNPSCSSAPQIHEELKRQTGQKTVP